MQRNGTDDNLFGKLALSGEDENNGVNIIVNYLLYSHSDALTEPYPRIYIFVLLHKHF